MSCAHPSVQVVANGVLACCRCRARKYLKSWHSWAVRWCLLWTRLHTLSPVRAVFLCARKSQLPPISTRCVRAEAKRNSRISRVATRRNLPSLQLADLKDMKRALMSRSAAAVADSSPAVRGANADDTSQSTITLGSDGTPCKLVAQPTALRYRAHTRRNRCWCLFHGQFMIQCPSRRPRVNKLARWPQPHRLQLTWQRLPPPLRQ